MNARKAIEILKNSKQFSALSVSNAERYIRKLQLAYNKQERVPSDRKYC